MAGVVAKKPGVLPARSAIPPLPYRGGRAAAGRRQGADGLGAARSAASISAAAQAPSFARSGAISRPPSRRHSRPLRPPGLGPGPAAVRPDPDRGREEPMGAAAYTRSLWTRSRTWLAPSANVLDTPSACRRASRADGEADERGTPMARRYLNGRWINWRRAPVRARVDRVGGAGVWPPFRPSRTSRSPSASFRRPRGGTIPATPPWSSPAGVEPDGGRGSLYVLDCEPRPLVGLRHHRSSAPQRRRWGARTVRVEDVAYQEERSKQNRPARRMERIQAQPPRNRRSTTRSRRSGKTTRKTLIYKGSRVVPPGVAPELLRRDSVPRSVAPGCLRVIPASGQMHIFRILSDSPSTIGSGPARSRTQHRCTPAQQGTPGSARSVQRPPALAYLAAGSNGRNLKGSWSPR